MAFYFNNHELEHVFFNNKKVEFLYYNNNRVYDAFSGYIKVISNPGSTINLSDGQTAVADSTTGEALFHIKQAGTYEATNNLGAYGTVTAIEKNVTYNMTAIYINPIASIGAGTYSANTAYVSWTNPSTYYSGVEVRYGTSVPTTPTSGTSMYTGTGSTITVSSTSKPNGCTKALTNGTTYYFSAFSYLTINGVKYYSPTVRSSGAWKAATVSGSKNFTSTQSFTIPTGVRSITVCCVGGGGWGGGTSADGSWNWGGGGGGGGYLKTGTYSVTPGTAYTVTIGGASGTTSFGSLLSAGGGSGGGSWGKGGAGQGAGGNAGYRVSQGSGNAPIISSAWSGSAGTTNGGTWYGGGGGGGDYSARDDWWTKLGQGNGGSGGGGKGATFSRGSWSNSRDEWSWNAVGAGGGGANTGGGGGGASGSSGAAAGGSGICKISYS